MIDNHELEQIMDKLENLEDEKLAATLLSEFNDASKVVGQLALNLDQSLSNEEWKIKIDDAQARLEAVLKELDRLQGELPTVFIQ